MSDGDLLNIYTETVTVKENEAPFYEGGLPSEWYIYNSGEHIYELPQAMDEENDTI